MGVETMKEPMTPDDLASFLTQVQRTRLVDYIEPEGETAMRAFDRKLAWARVHQTHPAHGKEARFLLNHEEALRVTLSREIEADDWVTHASPGGEFDEVPAGANPSVDASEFAGMYQPGELGFDVTEEAADDGAAGSGSDFEVHARRKTAWDRSPVIRERVAKQPEELPRVRHSRLFAPQNEENRPVTGSIPRIRAQKERSAEAEPVQTKSNRSALVLLVLVGLGGAGFFFVREQANRGIAEMELAAITAEVGAVDDAEPKEGAVATEAEPKEGAVADATEAEPKEGAVAHATEAEPVVSAPVVDPPPSVTTPKAANASKPVSRPKPKPAAASKPNPDANAPAVLSVVGQWVGRAGSASLMLSVNSQDGETFSGAVDLQASPSAPWESHKISGRVEEGTSTVSFATPDGRTYTGSESNGRLNGRYEGGSSAENGTWFAVR